MGWGGVACLIIVSTPGPGELLEKRNLQVSSFEKFSGGGGVWWWWPV